MQLVLISGLSGSGKSIAIKVLEDAGYYCVDNLPDLLLAETAAFLRSAGHAKVAVSIDARSGQALDRLPQTLDTLRQSGVDVRIIFLDAKNDTLVRRFAETRRRHPLARADNTIEECIALEREILAPLSELGHRIDTSDVQPNMLRSWMKDLLEVDTSRMTSYHVNELWRFEIVCECEDDFALHNWGLASSLASWTLAAPIPCRS